MTTTKKDITPEDREEIVRFIVGMRQSDDGHFWFIEELVPPEKAEDCPPIFETMRGFFKEDERVWRPMDNEKCDCCDAVDTSTFAT